MSTAVKNDLAGRSALRLALFALIIALLGAATGVGVAAMIRIPDVAALADFTPGLITEIADAKGRVFESYARQRRILLDEGELPARVRDAVLAAEDKNFFEHGGLDLLAILRSLTINLTAGSYETGASTITMQLARTQFLSLEKTWRRKIEEAFLAVDIEKRLSKEQILYLYLNLVNLGEGRYGVKEAARYYFDKDLDELSIAEAATLPAILPSPSVLSPYRRPDRVREGRDAILDRMLRAEMITEDEHRQAVETPLEVVPHRRRQIPGRYFAEEIRRHLESTYGEDSLYEQGLQVSSTLDLDMQRAAERAVRDGLSRLDRRRGWRRSVRQLAESDGAPESAELRSWPAGDLIPGAWYEGIVLESDGRSATIRILEQTFELGGSGVEWTGESRPDRLLERGDIAWFELLPPDADSAEPPSRVVLRQEPQMEAALVLLESATGAVRAMVGGWDFSRSQFNRATQAERLVGSAFKPFIYGAAIEAGFTPSDQLFDAPVAFPGGGGRLTYSPRNYEREYEGIITLRRALEHSVNVTSVKLLELVGIDAVIDFARRCGVTAALPPYPSLGLGTAEMSPLELAGAYAVLANNGLRVEPYMIERVRTHDGEVLEEHMPRASQAMRPEVAYVTTQMLRGVTQRGTGGSLADLGLAIAGKTGTTDSYTDAWFAGYSPRYTLLVWVGYDEKKFLGRGMTGAVAALPIWRRFVEQGVEAGWIRADDTFPRPPGVQTARVEYYTGLLATPDAARTIEESFLAGTEPELAYDAALGAALRLPWYQQRAFYGQPRQGERMPEQVEDWGPIRERWSDKAGR